MGENECTHPVKIHGLCARCGKEMDGEERPWHAILHSNPNVLLSDLEAERMGESHYQALMQAKRLVLLLDLDQTVIHTTVNKQFAAYFEELQGLGVPPGSMDENERALQSIHKIKIDGYNYYVKERGELRWFLEEAARLFEIHIYTMGNKKYAAAIAEILDPTKAIFGDRIVTRDDNFGSFDKDITRLFPKNSSNVVILDDRPDVWRFSRNLLPIRPFCFFRTGDLNSPEKLKEMLRMGGENPVQEESPQNIRQSLYGDGALPPVEKKRSIVCRRIMEECIAEAGDTELRAIMGVLRDVHREFFSDQASMQGKEGVRVVLDKKKRIFAGCVAVFFMPSEVSERYFETLFLQYGGQVHARMRKSTTHVIVGGSASYVDMGEYNCKCVKVEWVLDSIFSLSRRAEEPYEGVEGEGAEENADTSSESISELWEDEWERGELWDK